MINDLIRLKVPSVTSTLSFNILLHVTILFTILSIFFTKYISQVSSNIINKEIIHIVNDGIDKINIKDIVNDGIDKINIKDIVNDGIDKINIKLSQNILLKNSLIEQLKNSTNINEKIELQDKIKQTTEILNKLQDKIKQTTEILNKLQNINIKNKFPYDYYINLFSKEDMTRQNINNEVFFYIKFTNILLIVFLILFAFYLVKTNALNIHQIKEIGLENVLTFILVGAIEFIFFNNVAMKYIPTAPSLLFTSFINGFN